MRMGPSNRLQRRFFERLGRPWDLSQLFDYLPDTYFYAKNLRGRFVLVNRALAVMLGAAGAEEMVGKSDYDFSPRDLADQYVAEDRRVMHTGEPVIHQPWLVADHRGTLKWYLSSKIPLFDRFGKVIGIAGAMRDVEKAGELLAPYREMEAVVRHLLTRYEEKIDFHGLARLVGLSISQFDRRFKRLFQLTPEQFPAPRPLKRGLPNAGLHRPQYLGDFPADRLLRPEPLHQILPSQGANDAHRLPRAVSPRGSWRKR